jgi:splicing suppressor protein 51
LACEYCTGRAHKSIFFSGTYHDFMPTTDYVQNPPDIVVGFHTGFSEVNVEHWKPTLEAILDSGVPAAFTAYTMVEAKMEAERLEQMGARFVVPVGWNKWRGGAPRIHAQLEREVFYWNNAWCVVKGRI